MFRSTSCYICLSRLGSAISCFSVLFSSSRTLRRRTSATSIPRNQGFGPAMPIPEQDSANGARQSQFFNERTNETGLTAH